MDFYSEVREAKVKNSMCESQKCKTAGLFLLLSEQMPRSTCSPTQFLPPTSKKCHQDLFTKHKIQSSTFTQVSKNITFQTISISFFIPHPQQGNSTIKRIPLTARIQKGHPKHSNINKMKRQRNTQQVKEQDKCPPNQRGRDREST